MWIAFNIKNAIDLKAEERAARWLCKEHMSVELMQV